MRRLTEFEQNVVAKIYESDLNGIIFSELISSEKFTEYVLKVGEDTIGGETKNVINLCSNLLTEKFVADGFSDYNYFFKEIRKHYDTLKLIYLLEENGLIHIETVKLFDSYFIPFILDSKVSESDINGFVLNEEKGKTVYHSLIVKDITERDLNIIVNSHFQPAAALEIFVENGYKTDEQKIHDESISINKQSLRIAKYSALYALLAVGGSVLFSAFTLAYTAYHDYKRDSLEDERYLLEHPTDTTKVKTAKVTPIR